MNKWVIYIFFVFYLLNPCLAFAAASQTKDDKKSIPKDKPIGKNSEAKKKKRKKKKKLPKETIEGADSQAFLKEEEKKRIKWAFLASVLLPGGGQAFVNKKPLKAVGFWAGMGGFGLATYISHKKYKKVKKRDNLYRRFRNGFIFGMVVVYAWNILDALADAHLQNYEISRNLEYKKLTPDERHEFKRQNFKRREKKDDKK